MARIRTVKPEYWQDEKMAAAPVIDRLVFLGLISMADDAGRVLDNIKVIDAFIFPASEDSAATSLARLTVSGRLRRGVADSGQNVLEIVNWARHQKIDKPNLKATLPKIVKDNSLTGLSPTPPRYIADKASNHTNDHHTTTNDQRPIARPKATKPAPSWVAEAHAIYHERIGLLPHGRFGAALKSAVQEYGWETIRRWFTAYCDTRPYRRRDGSFHGDLPSDNPGNIPPRNTDFMGPEDFVKNLTTWKDRCSPLVPQ